MTTTLVIAALIVIGLLSRSWVLTANANVSTFVDQDIREFPVGAAVHIYRDALVGIDPAGHLKAFVPGDRFVGLAYEEIDNSAGAAAALMCRVKVQLDFQYTLTGVALTDVGKAVYATADDAIALTGHPDAFVGRIINRPSANTAVIRLRGFNEKPGDSDTGCIDLASDFGKAFVTTGADGAGDGPQYVTPFKHASALGLGVAPVAGEDVALLSFDAVAEIASATIVTPDVFPVAQGITFEGRLHMTGIGDHAAIDVDFGIGTLLTANSIADIDHADMVNLAAFHMDGASANILAQSDDVATDVVPVDTTIDNVVTAGSFKDFKIIVRPTGAVEFWIDGVRVLSSTTFAVAASATLGGFVNIEKTSNDTLAAMKIDDLRIAGARAA